MATTKATEKATEKPNVEIEIDEEAVGVYLAEHVPEPNIRFVAKEFELNGKTIVPEPVLKFHGADALLLGKPLKTLPSADVQRAGWYAPNATVLIQILHRLAGQDAYKLIIPKGGQF